MSNSIYYHFLSSRNAIHDLERQMIKVSLIDTLDDPFELMPYLRKMDREHRKLYYDVRKNVSKKYGLLCFSKNWNEPLLWGHYADKHKGVALGFAISKYRIIEVDYQPKRIKLELKDNPKHNETAFLIELVRTKYHNWKYENEIRILVSLKDCIKLGGHFFINFDDNLSLKEIILGCKFDNNEEYILKLSQKLNAKVIPSRMAFGEYSIIKHGSKSNKFQKILNSMIPAIS